MYFIYSSLLRKFHDSLLRIVIHSQLAFTTVPTFRSSLMDNYFISRYSSNGSSFNKNNTNTRRRNQSENHRGRGTKYVLLLLHCSSRRNHLSFN